MKKMFIRFSIAQKLMFSSLVFCVPVLMMLFAIGKYYNKQIDVAKNEIAGIELITASTRIIALLPANHSEFINEEGKNIKNSRFLEFSESLIDSSFRTLIENSYTYKEQLPLSIPEFQHQHIGEIHPENIFKLWKTLLTNRSKMSPQEVNAQYRKIYDFLHDYITYIGGKSQLLLDPSPDIYFLSQASIHFIPRIYQQINIIADLSVDLKANGKLNDFQKGELEAALEGLDYYAVYQTNKVISTTLTGNVVLFSKKEMQESDIPTYISEFNTNMSEFIRILREQTNQDLPTAYTTYNKSLKKNLETNSKLWKAINETILAKAISKEKEMEKNRLLAFLISIAFLSFAIILIRLVAKSVSKSIKLVNETASVIASGKLKKAKRLLDELIDFSQLDKVTKKHIKAKDDTVLLLYSFKKMTESIDSLITKMQSTGTRVKESSIQITSGAVELEAVFAQHVSSTSEVNSVTKEISSTAFDLATTMNNVLQSTIETSEVAQKGMHSLNDIKLIMDRLAEASRTINLRLEAIRSKTMNINQVITTITKVANQTNLLSLNASIEAEKAGEHGAGFSVVAREIRRLADQTSVAALEIEEMINQMHEAVGQSVSSVGDYARESMLSSMRITEMSEDLERLIQYSNDVLPQFQSITHGMAVQAEAAEQIHNAMNQISDAAFQTKDSLTGLNQITDKLNDIILELNYEIQAFS